MDFGVVPKRIARKSKDPSRDCSRVFCIFKRTGLVIILGQVSNRPSEILSVTCLSNLHRVRKPIVKAVTSPR
jgi:hypothetical protein